MRDIAAHGYYEMDDRIIWMTAKEKIPELMKFLESYLTD